MSLSTSEQLKLLMQVNLLGYSPPVDGSLCNSRQLKKYVYQGFFTAFDGAELHRWPFQ